jgi:hypothetical protein
VAQSSVVASHGIVARHLFPNEDTDEKIDDERHLKTANSQAEPEVTMFKSIILTAASVQ